MLNRKLFGLVFGLVITVPFALHGIGHKGWDPIGQMIGTNDLKAIPSMLVDQIAVSQIDPSLDQANTTATSEGRSTILADVWLSLDGLGAIGVGAQGTQEPHPTPTDGSGLPSTLMTPPVFADHGDSISATFTVMGVSKVCTITISNGLAIRSC